MVHEKSLLANMTRQVAGSCFCYLQKHSSSAAQLPPFLRARGGPPPMGPGGRPFGPPRSPFRPPVGLIRGRPPFAFRPGMPPPQRPPGFSPSGIRTPPSRKGSLAESTSPRHNISESPPPASNMFEKVGGGSRRSSQQPLLPTVGESSPVLESPEPYSPSEDHRQQHQLFEDDLEWSTDRMGGYDSPTRQATGSTNLDTDYRHQPTTSSSDPEPPQLHNDILSDQSWVTKPKTIMFTGTFILYIKQLHFPLNFCNANSQLVLMHLKRVCD